MPISVALCVLFAALLHAGWNAMVKAAPDKSFNMALVAGGAGCIGAALLLVLPAPAPASWKFLAGSTVLQAAYYPLLAAAYAAGDMSQAYPVMRGLAPLLVALASLALTGEALPLWGWAGLGLISAGIGLLAVINGGARSGRPVLGYALAGAVVIAGNTLMESQGVRRSGLPLSYTAWVYVCGAIPALLWLVRGRAAAFLRYASRYGWIALVAGGSSLLAYGIALWAMTRAPVGVVAALRESSILFAVVISILVLRERPGWWRMGAIGLIVTGVVVVRLR